MSYLQQLNEVQKAAVTTLNGPVMVVAGPGSGKTRVLTFRIAHLIKEGVPPWQILALTFTNKAAREMRARIEKLVGDQARDIWAGTFHSLFARILRYEADKIGYPKSFTIYDRDDSKSVVQTIIRELHLNKDAYNVNSVLNRISLAKTQLLSPKRYAQNPEALQEDQQMRMPRFSEVYAKYTARCKRSGAMDFDDLLYRFFELLQNHPDVLEKYRKRFQYLLVDEFQDTNYLQYAILKKLVRYEGSPENICIVGDDAQSIYAFRGATVENMLDFEKDFSDTRIFKLVQNYRSTHPIVQAANGVIAKNQGQIKKTIQSEKGEGPRIQMISATTDNEEGRRVADSIVEQKNRHHLANKDIAILYRTNAQSRIFEEQLRRYNIPYRIFGGQSFYQRKEVKDVIAYLRMAVNPNDEEALRRIINYPRRGIGKTTIDKLSQEASVQELPIWQYIQQGIPDGRMRKKITPFRQMIERFQELALKKDAYKATDMIVRESGLLDELKKDNSIEGLGRLENIQSLLGGIQEFVEDEVLSATEEETAEKSLAAYLQSIALMTDLDQNSGEGDYVTLMSTHSAKGLEFGSVFVVGLEEKLFPSWLSMDSPEGLSEERRLFYVAITRAEKLLTLSFAKSRYKFGKMIYNQPSRFLEELPPNCLADSSALVAATASRRKGTPRSGVTGSFKRKSSPSAVNVDLSNFKPDPSSKIQVGQQVLHAKFGKGKVLSIDGTNENRVATLFFPQLGEEKRIMLRFAKLMILT